MLCIIITCCVFLALALRFVYINIICNDWNYKLGFYLNYLEIMTDYDELEQVKLLNYHRGKDLNPRIYWLSFNKWTVKRIINDAFVFDDVNKYFKSIK